MFNHKHYIPILKGKEGEFDALRTLSRKTRLQLTPFIDVTYPSRQGKMKPVPLDVHLAKIVSRILNCWGIHEPIFVDLFDIKLTDRIQEGILPVSYLFDYLRSRSILAIPTTGLDRDEPYNEAIAKIIARDQRGACIRILGDDMDDVYELHEDLSQLRSALKSNEEDLHLLIDFRFLLSAAIPSAVEKATEILNSLPNIQNWKTVTLAASAYPQSLMGIKPNSIKRIKRCELELWFSVMSKTIKRIPLFGDYGIVNPITVEFDSSRVSSSAKIRYTVEKEWLIVKGKSLRTHPDKFKQYHNLAGSLSKMADFLGPTFSPGDTYIKRCASHEEKSGSLTTWITVDTSHHLTFVADQIAKMRRN